jgi:hypothetical protein
VINKWAYIRGGAYIWNEVSVSTCGGLIHGILSKSTHEQGRRNLGGAGGAREARAPPNFFKGLKLPFFVMKSTFFCDEKCPFL